MVQPLPWFFAVLQYFDLPLLESLSCDLQAKINIMGYWAAGVRHFGVN